MPSAGPCPPRLTLRSFHSSASAGTIAGLGTDSFGTRACHYDGRSATPSPQFALRSGLHRTSLALRISWPFSATRSSPLNRAAPNLARFDSAILRRQALNSFSLIIRAATIRRSRATSAQHCHRFNQGNLRPKMPAHRLQSVPAVVRKYGCGRNHTCQKIVQCTTAARFPERQQVQIFPSPNVDFLFVLIPNRSGLSVPVQSATVDLSPPLSALPT